MGGRVGDGWLTVRAFLPPGDMSLLSGLQLSDPCGPCPWRHDTLLMPFARNMLCPLTSDQNETAPANLCSMAQPVTEPTPLAPPPDL